MLFPFKGKVEAKSTFTADAITENPTITYDVITGSSINGTIPVHITENLIEFTESISTSTVQQTPNIHT